MIITVIVFLMSCILSLPLVSHAASSGKGGLGISAGMPMVPTAPPAST